MKMRLKNLRLDCYKQYCWRRRITTTRTTTAGTVQLEKRTKAFPISSASSASFLFNSSPSFLLLERNGILPCINQQRRFYSSDTDDRTATAATTTNFSIGNNSVLEKAASAAKEHAVERRKKRAHSFPQLRGATDNLLNVTEAVESLSHSIEGIRGGSSDKNDNDIDNDNGNNINTGCASSEPNKSAETCIRELHRAFLNLTQACLDHYETTAKENRHEDRIYRFQLLESVLALSYRAHQLSLPYHWPLYQRLAIAVAKHDENTTVESSTTTMDSLTSCSRAELILKIHRWSLFPSSGSSDSNEGDIDLDWFFYPSLKLLAMNRHWSDFRHILMDRLRPVPDVIPTDDEGYNRSLHTGSNTGFRSTEAYKKDRNYRQDTLVGAFEDDCDNNNDIEDGYNYDYDFEDYTVEILSATTVPFLEEEFVLDILMELDRQGLLVKLWENGSRYPPPNSVKESCDILLMMEASIWKIFGGIPGQPANTNNEENLYSDKEKNVRKNSGRYNLPSQGASLRNAIEILVKNEPKNNEIYKSMNFDDNEDEEEFFNDGGKDFLAKTLNDLEDLLNEQEQQDVNVKDDKIDENERQSEEASDALALATALSNQMAGKDFVLNNTDDDYLDFIYDDRAEDYRDNIPDITSQIYSNNGNQELLYTTSLECHIYDEMQRSPPGGYNSEDDE
jgi:hypothetical protein